MSRRAEKGGFSPSDKSRLGPTDMPKKQKNMKQQGQQGNIRQNTRNQGYQQDR